MSKRPHDHHRVQHGDDAAANERPNLARVPVEILPADQRLVDVHDPADHLIGALVRDDEAGYLHMWAQTHGTTPRAVLDPNTDQGPQFVEFYAPRGDALELLCERCRNTWPVTASQLLDAAERPTRRGKVSRLRLS